jgi:hypothetical protein
MNKLVNRIRWSFLSDRKLMDLYIGLQLRFPRLQQQTHYAYWLEEATVSRMILGDGWDAWCRRQQNHSLEEMGRLLDLRTSMMLARPKLFANYNWDPLRGVDVTDRYHWQSRDTYKAYRKIVDAMDNDPQNYKRKTS